MVWQHPIDVFGCARSIREPRGNLGRTTHVTGNIPSILFWFYYSNILTTLNKRHSVVVQSSVRACKVIRDVIIHEATQSSCLLKERSRRCEADIKEQSFHFRAVRCRHRH